MDKLAGNSDRQPEKNNSKTAGVMNLRPGEYYREFNEEVNKEILNREQPVKNALLLSMSTFGGDKLESNRYTYWDGRKSGEVEGYTQLEPVPKMLFRLLKKKNEKLDMIIVLATKEAKNEKNFKVPDYNANVISFFGSEIKKVLPDTEIIVIDAPGESESPVKALRDAVGIMRTIKAKNPEARFYLDMHGGLRHVQLIVDAIVFALQTDGITIEHAYTVTFNSGNRKSGSIIEVDDYIKIFDYVAGIKEFMNHGQGNSLGEFLKGEPSSKIVESIKNVSNKLLLCQMGSFEQSLDEMNKNMLEYGDDANDYLSLFIDSVKGNYNTKYGDLLNEKERNLKAELTWALEKHLYQQCLAVIESKFPDYFWRYLDEKALKLKNIKKNKPIEITDEAVKSEFNRRGTKTDLINILLFRKGKSFSVEKDRGKCVLKGKMLVGNNSMYSMYSMEFPTYISEDSEKALKNAIKLWESLKEIRNEVMHLNEERMAGITMIKIKIEELITNLDKLDNSLDLCK